MLEGNRQGWAMFVAAVVASLVVGFSTQRLGWALLAGVLFVATMWRFFLPVTFELSALGVIQEAVGRRRRIPWSAIDRYQICRYGVILSSQGAPLEALRGLYLPWGNHRDEVLDILQYYLPWALKVDPNGVDTS